MVQIKCAFKISKVFHFIVLVGSHEVRILVFDSYQCCPRALKVQLKQSVGLILIPGQLLGRCILFY